VSAGGPTSTPATTGAHSPAEVSRVAHEFTALYHDLRDQTLGRTRWFGISIVKTPTDLVVLQEIVAETRPELIIETGVFAGGSALFFASLLDALGIDGRVVGIDVDMSLVTPHIGQHPRVELIEGSSTDPALVERLRAEAQGRRVMVDLDADHTQEHVLAELRALGPLVTPGCYLVVEDTWFGGRPVRPDLVPGPAEALEQWLAEGQPFEIDRWRERFLLTGIPGGYLRRLDPSGAEPGGPPRLDGFAVPGLAMSSAEASGGPDQEQGRRYAHEAEFESLRADFLQVRDELRVQTALVAQRDELIAELRAQATVRGRGKGAKGRLRARAQRAARALPGDRRHVAERAPRQSESPGSEGQGSDDDARR
jgi:cephalosporin hydroxylase